VPSVIGLPSRNAACINRARNRDQPDDDAPAALTAAPKPTGIRTQAVSFAVEPL
jgi:hypothetical protein